MQDRDELSVASHVNSQHVYDDVWPIEMNTKDTAIQITMQTTPKAILKPSTRSIEIQYEVEEDEEVEDVVAVQTYSTVATQYVAVPSVKKKAVIKDKTLDHLYAINAMIEQSQDTELALLDDQLTESCTKTMLSQFNLSLKRFDDFDWSDCDDKMDKYAPSNVDKEEDEEEVKKDEIEEEEEDENNGDKAETNENVQSQNDENDENKQNEKCQQEEEDEETNENIDNEQDVQDLENEENDVKKDETDTPAADSAVENIEIDGDNKQNEE
eukprot:516707_1